MGKAAQAVVDGISSITHFLGNIWGPLKYFLYVVIIVCMVASLMCIWKTINKRVAGLSRNLFLLPHDKPHGGPRRGCRTYAWRKEAEMRTHR